MARQLRCAWDVPATLFDDGFPEAAFLEQVKQDAVGRRCVQGRIASGYAASRLGLRRRAFVECLQRQGIPLAQYTAADWEEEHQSLREMEGKRLQELRTTEHED